MSDTIMSVTEAARNFADCVNRAYYQHQTFLLLKNGVPFARLVPAGPAVCRGVDLAEVFTTAPLSSAEADDWRRDLKTARKKLKPPRNVWE